MRAHYLGHVVFYVRDLERSLGWNSFMLVVLPLSWPFFSAER